MQPSDPPADDLLSTPFLQAHPLERDESAGMNPTSILTGYGVKGEKVRHVVHEGALRLPTAALSILEERSHDGSRSRVERFRLPGLDSVRRPSRDPEAIPHMTVTEIYGVVLPADPVAMLPERLQCYARNRRWPIHSKEPPAPALERIRGGGEEGPPGEPPASSSPPAEPHPTPLAETNEAALTGSLPLVTAPSATSTTQGGPTPAPNAGPPPTPTTLTIPSVTTTSMTAHSSSAPPKPAAVSSASVHPAVPAVAPSRSLPEVVPLASQPEAQWQQHIPTDKAAAVGRTTRRPDWFQADQVSDLERTALPEWFDGSALHRTEKSYLATRNRMVEISERLVNRYVTTTMIRRSIPGDIGSLMRMYSFLSAYCLLNDGAVNESAPTPVTLQESKAKYRWSEPLQRELLYAVVEESRKRRRRLSQGEPSDFEPVLDWEAVAKTVGHGVSATDCERQFLAMPLAEQNASATADRAITPEVTAKQDSSDQPSKEPIAGEQSARTIMNMQQEWLEEIIDRCDNGVVSAVTEAAIRATTSDGVAEAQRGAVVGLLVHEALEQARSSEERISRIMSEIVDLRMKKLENRLSMLDDIEGLLESERVALELERRDLYTTRCRHWFGGT